MSSEKSPSIKAIDQILVQLVNLDLEDVSALTPEQLYEQQFEFAHDRHETSGVLVSGTGLRPDGEEPPQELVDEATPIYSPDNGPARRHPDPVIAPSAPDDIFQEDDPAQNDPEASLGEPPLPASATTDRTSSFASSEAATPTASPPLSNDDRSTLLKWHGACFLLNPVDNPQSREALLQPPKAVATSSQQNRPGYESRNASEFLDRPAARSAKLRFLASMIKQNARNKTTVVYSGAGLSTAAGIGDYASRATESRAPHKSTTSGGGGSRLSLEPTLGHHAVALLEKKGLVHHWLQQNHDRLAQKAGFPQKKLNEIHGAWGDFKNPVVDMEGRLRSDLLKWLESWEERVEGGGGLCLVLGSSLCGMNADRICRAAAARGRTGGDGNGLVIIGLQATALDHLATVRIWGLLDDVLKELVIKHLKLAKNLPSAECRRAGEDWVGKHPNCRFDTPVVREFV